MLVLLLLLRVVHGALRCGTALPRVLSMLLLVRRYTWRCPDPACEVAGTDDWGRVVLLSLLLLLLFRSSASTLAQQGVC